MPGPTRSVFLYLLTAFCLLLPSRGGFAFEEGWYLGAGYGASHLDPEIPFDIFEASENESELARVFAGYDFSRVGGVELVVSDLGQAELNNGDVVEYASADVVGLYRLYDHQERHHGRSIWDFNLFGKIGLGYLDLQSDTALESGSRIHMLVGVGGELNLFWGFALRTELEFIDSDALAAHVSLLKRFAFDKPSRPLSPSAATSLPRASETGVPPATPPAASVPAPDSTLEPVRPPLTPAPEPQISDEDKDGVEDARDQCRGSRPGYPVRDNGCGLLNGILANIRFEQYSADLSEQTRRNLLGLANLLKKYPAARVQLIAHTAAERTEQEQITLTWERLRAIALYLRDQGVSGQQVKYLAYGARAAVPKGMPADRIEIKELP